MSHLIISKGIYRCSRRITGNYNLTRNTKYHKCYKLWHLTNLLEIGAKENKSSFKVENLSLTCIPNHEKEKQNKITSLVNHEIKCVTDLHP